MYLRCGFGGGSEGGEGGLPLRLGPLVRPFAMWVGSGRTPGIGTVALGVGEGLKGVLEVHRATLWLDGDG